MSFVIAIANCHWHCIVIVIVLVIELLLFLSLNFFFFTTCLGKSKAIVWQIQCSSEVSFRTPIELSQFYHQCQFQLYDIRFHQPMYCCLNWSLYSQVQRWQLRFGLKWGLAGGQQSCRLLSSRRLATSHSTWVTQVSLATQASEAARESISHCNPQMSFKNPD